MFSLMDGFSDYNQIMISKEDKHEMVFTTPWGTYYYKVISFILKNIRVTYKRSMPYIIHDYMYDIVKDYMDELIVKTKIYDTHL